MFDWDIIHIILYDIQLNSIIIYFKKLINTWYRIWIYFFNMIIIHITFWLI